MNDPQGRNDHTEYYVDEFYLPGATIEDIPEVFLVQDAEYRRQHPEPKYVKEPHDVYVPVPTIDQCPGTTGPIYCTEEWYAKAKVQRWLIKRKEQQECEIRVVQLLAQKEHLKRQIGFLDTSTKHGGRDLERYNARIKEIDHELEWIELGYGVKIDEIERGSRWARFKSSVRGTIRRHVKKVKKFFRSHQETIVSACSIALPIVGAILIKSIL